jgi:hypothetical protein
MKTQKIESQYHSCIPKSNLVNDEIAFTTGRMEKYVFIFH